MFLTSKLIICFSDRFTFKKKSQSISYLLNGSDHICWIFNIENEVHSIWASGLQECKGNFISGSRVEQTTVSFEIKIN